MVSLASPSGEALSYYWQFRYREETDRGHKKHLSKKSAAILFDRNSKDDLLLADFLYRFRRDEKKTKADYSFLVADFDVLPEGFDNFDNLIYYLKENFPNAIVLKSPSDKAKIMFLVEQDWEPDVKEKGPRWYALCNLLKEKRLFCFDPKVTASYKVYFNSEMLSQWLDQKSRVKLMGKVSELARSGGWSFISSSMEKKKEQKRLRRYQGNIPNELFLIKSDNFEGFLRILIASPKLNVGAHLPQESIAKELKISRQMVQRYIKLMKMHGHLKIINHNYIKGIKAKEYRAESALLLELHENCYIDHLNIERLPPPEKFHIPDGQWNKKLFFLTNYFSDEASYLSYVEHLQGIKNKKERIRQAKSAWKSHQKRKNTTNSITL